MNPTHFATEDIDAETSAFKRHARLPQALWRQARGLPGTQPMRPRAGAQSRSLGSRLEIEFALNTGAIFLSDAAREAAAWRVAHPEPKQTLNTDRSAFDVAFETAQPDGSQAIVGVETKYHEHCVAERVPGESRLERYRRICDASGVFRPGTVEAVIGTHLQQIWLDHLLALPLLQDESRKYSWAKFVLVHPAANPSYARAAAACAKLLGRRRNVPGRTLESLLEASAYPKERAEGFRERYFWSRSAPARERSTASR